MSTAFRNRADEARLHFVAAEIERVAGQLQDRLSAMGDESGPRKVFLGTYLRTTRAVGQAVDEGRFEDPDWVEGWDAAFAGFYVRALDAFLDGRTTEVSRPWRIAFAAPAQLPALAHVLLGINAHINYDLPQALIAVIGPEDFGDLALIDKRRRDHERIDAVLAGRVSAEDDELAATSAKSRLDQVLTPLNRLASRRFLSEARAKVWHNTRELHNARLTGQYERRLAELEVLAAARVADLMRPGQVLLRLAVSGFGVTLPPAG